MTTDDAIWPRLIEVLRETFDDDRLAVTAESTARDVEGWDSVSHIQLLVAIEKEFGIRFNTGEVAGLKNVGEMAALIRSKVA